VTFTALNQDQSTVDGELFRRVLRHHAAGVVVVTAPGRPPAGFTATSFTSISMHPPLISVSLSHTSSTWATIETAELIAVHVLAHDQEHVARTFATSGVDRFATHTAWHEGPDGVPLLDGVLARLVCRVARRVVAGDHTIVLATPVAGHYGADETHPPLLYHAGRYANLHYPLG
jgi:flavin reductase (DIM6/NTAB) family NADH-FMN oxidoreductase RutF